MQEDKSRLQFLGTSKYVVKGTIDQVSNVFIGYNIITFTGILGINQMLT